MVNDLEALKQQFKGVEPSVKAKDIAKEHDMQIGTVYKMASRGLIPSYKVGKLVRFKRSLVNEALGKRRDK